MDDDTSIMDESNGAPISAITDRFREALRSIRDDDWQETDRGPRDIAADALAAESRGSRPCSECRGYGYLGVFSATHGAPCPSCGGSGNGSYSSGNNDEEQNHGR